MKTADLIQVSKSDLALIASRLSENGIETVVSIIREGTPGEYPMILIKDIEKLDGKKLLEIREAVNASYKGGEKLKNSDYVVSLGYTTSEAVLEIRPRFSFLTESEKNLLTYNK